MRPLSWLIGVALAITLCCADDAPPPQDPIDALLEYELWPELPGGMELPPWTPGPDGRPTADAPAEAVYDFWSTACARMQSARRPTIAPAQAETLLSLVERRPAFIDSVIRCLPETAEAVERVRKLHAARGPKHAAGAGCCALSEWLLSHGAVPLEHTRAVAAGARALEQLSYIQGEPELRALARFDWGAAAPLLERFASGDQPALATLAVGLQFAHAAGDGEAATAESLRRRLQTVATNPAAPALARERACRALAGTPWDGRDEWIVALLRDASLREPQTDDGVSSLLAGAVAEDPAHWLPLVVAQISSSDRAAHDAAVNCVTRFCGADALPEALRPLLPWLEDPGWSSACGREELVKGLAVVPLPESVPGLIREVRRADENELIAAAKALQRQGDARALDALRQAFARTGCDRARPDIVNALVECGLGLKERADAIIAATAAQATPGAAPDPSHEAALGRLLLEGHHADEGIAEELFRRAEGLDRERPEAALRLRALVMSMPGKASAWLLAEPITRGELEPRTVRGALARRKALAASFPLLLEPLLLRRGAIRGVAAVLLERPEERLKILSSPDREAARALLACARLTGDTLPAADVARLFDTGDPRVAKAARRYLEEVGGIEGRRALLARPEMKGTILGLEIDRFREFVPWEARLQKELAQAGGPSEVIAVLNCGDSGGQIVIRVRDGKARLAVHEWSGRRLSRELSGAELAGLRADLAAAKADGLDRFWTHNYGSAAWEYLHLMPEGGIRVVMDVLGGESPHNELVNRFRALADPARLRPFHPVTDAVAGAQLLYTDLTRKVLAPVVEDGTLKLLLQEEGGAEQLYLFVSVTEPQKALWRTFLDGKLGVESKPPACVLKTDFDAKLPNGMLVHHPPFRWQTRIGAAQVVSGWGTRSDGLWTPGLWWVRTGESPRCIAAGNIAHPIVTPDGRWIVAAETAGSWAIPNYVVRVDPESGEKLRVDLPEADNFNPVAYVAEHHAVLLTRYGDARRFDGTSPTGPLEPEFYLFVPENAGVRRVTGEFGPWEGQSLRSLQPTGRPHQAWAARRNERIQGTDLGRYDTRDFTFEVVASYPALQFDSMTSWVDEERGMVYVAFSGDLLSLPLPQTKAPK
ncbi:MAG: HEAT repeat domain-containing protein [Planctomycetes bacterium]|nr:HEAT repeat domain-containing protein [Planctomycetota bacterium]